MNYHLFLPRSMLRADVMDRELSLAHRMSLQTLLKLLYVRMRNKLILRALTKICKVLVVEYLTLSP